MIIQDEYKKSNGTYYRNEEVKVLKEYPTFILIERKAGYKECIHKQELGLIKERIKPPATDLNPEKIKI